MKILHIWDICDNSRYISEKITPWGHESIVIDRKKLTVGKYRFILNVIYHLIRFKPDIVHVNAWTKGVILTRIFARKSKILMHFHGSDIRDKEIPKSVLKYSDEIFCSTKDLLKQPMELLPVIVRDNFFYRGNRVKNTALYVHWYKDYMEKARHYCWENDLKLTIINRMDKSSMIIPHSLMPKLLSTMDYYLDFKGYTSIDTLTLTAKEALMCGCKVVVDNLDIVTDFPQTTIHDYIAVYQKLI